MKERRRKLTGRELQQRLEAFGLTKRVIAPGERDREVPDPDGLDYIAGERLRQRRLEVNP